MDEFRRVNQESGCRDVDIVPVVVRERKWYHIGRKSNPATPIAGEIMFYKLRFKSPRYEFEERVEGLKPSNGLAELANIAALVQAGRQFEPYFRRLGFEPVTKGLKIEEFDLPVTASQEYVHSLYSTL